MRRVHVAVTAAPDGRSTVRPSSTDVDPFIGTAATCLPPPQRAGRVVVVAASRRSATPIRAPRHRSAWCRPARSPVPTPPATAATARTPKACPTRCSSRPQASGFTHFQQSGTGAIRKYYNYVRVTPMVAAARRPRRVVGAARRDGRSPGTTRPPWTPACAARSPSARRSPSTATRSRSTRSARVVLDLSCGGLAIDHGRTVPLRAHVESMGYGRAQGTVVMEGVPLSVYLEVRQARLAADALVRPPADRGRHPARLRPHPADHAAPVRPALHGPGPRRADASRCASGFSLRGCEQARENL